MARGGPVARHPLPDHVKSRPGVIDQGPRDLIWRDVAASFQRDARPEGACCCYLCYCVV